MTTLTKNSLLNNCEFCDEFAGGSANSFTRQYANEVNSRIILERDGFCAIPTMGQIVPGYLLLVPRGHYRAFGDLPPELLSAADAIKTDLTRRMRALYGDIVLFEHGARTENSGGCGISHAHLHLVPFLRERDPVEQLIEQFPFEQISSFCDLRHARPGNPYLYYETADGSKYVFYPTFIPSQHVRQLLADALGHLRWDWRQCGREESLLSTLREVSQHLLTA